MSMKPTNTTSTESTNVTPTEPTNVTPTEPTNTTEMPSFDDYLASGGQSEFDKRVHKALGTAKAKWEEAQTKILDQRNADLTELQEKLKNFEGTTAEFEALKTKYQEDAKSWEVEKQQQAYQFAVKQAANGVEFSSTSAKNYFIEKCIGEGLKMKNGEILGFNDFLENYKQNDPSAVKTVDDNNAKPNPTFVNPSQGSAPGNEQLFQFGFNGVRHKK